jgi:hypothetical protein
LKGFIVANLKQDYQRKDTFFRRWASAIILLVFFLGSWGGQFVTQLQAEKQQSEQHHEQFQMAEFWPEFWSSTFENWQSEWLQLLTQAIVIAGFAEYLFRKGEEGHYKTQLMIEDLQKEVRAKKANRKPKQS